MRALPLLLLALLVAPTLAPSCDAEAPAAAEPPAGARAHRISHARDLIRGPLAHGQVGDWLLENEVARFVVQDAPRRDLHSIGQFGGNLIDAELVGRPDRDQFFELQPMLNIETVVNAENVEVVNDGSDGGAAILRACGPDDILDYVNASSQIAQLGATLPALADDVDLDIEACTEYRLEPGSRAVQVTTTVVNLQANTLGLYVGDYVNGMGSLEQWTRTGFPVAGVGEALITGTTRLLSYYGFGDAEGVDYTLVPIEFPGSGIDSSTFTTSGVSVMLHSHSVLLVLGFGFSPTFQVPAGASRSFTRHFAVGDGSAGNGVEIEAALRGQPSGRLGGCVTIGGAPAPGARVALGLLGGAEIVDLSSHYVTGPDGCWSGIVPAGSYGIAASREGAPFAGGGSSPLAVPVSVPAGGEVLQDLALPATGRLAVRVDDAAGHAIPARVTVIGFDPSPEPEIFGTVLSAGDTVTNLFYDLTRDRFPYGVARAIYTGADGLAEFDLEPGSYQVAVSRGSEWSLHSEPVEIAPDETTPVHAVLAQVLDTRGFISSDFHVHLLNSPDSRVGYTDRLASFAGEGIENLIATDHDAHTPLRTQIQRAGLVRFLHATVGEEITTFDYGHFNAYPLGVDPTLPSGGSTDWGRAAPLGADFKSLGSYGLSPAEIEAAVTGNPLNERFDPVVQVNHIGSHLLPLAIDTGLEPPSSGITPAELASLRLDPTLENLFHPFPALELWNGYTRSHQLSEFLNERIGVWMNLLNQGMRTTAIADTDTHTLLELRTAGARSWTPSATDRPPGIRDRQIARSVREGKAIGGQGLFVEARVVPPAAAGKVWDRPPKAASLPGIGHRLHDATLLSADAVSLEIRVQAPLWAPFDRIEVYANAATLSTGGRDGIPVHYTAEPTQVLHAGLDFAVEPVVVETGVPGASRLEARLSLPYALAEDTWFVVLARGSDGVSAPAFPVFPADLDPAENPTLEALVEVTPAERGVRALGFTNALYVDADGNGHFDAPGVRFVEPAAH